jgi:prefoldin subunit 5
MSDDDIVDHVALRVRELERHLDTFSERLRALRQRNRELEQEISVFEEDIERLRTWLRREQETS